jgi:type I restriction enzyme, R subunit
LKEKWSTLSKVGETAERNVHQDPNTAISKLRTFAETIAKYIVASENIKEERGTNQVDRLNTLYYDQILPKEIYDLFNLIRLKGNKATHDPTYGDVTEAKALLHMAFRIGVWFMEVYGDWNFQAPTYQEPKPEKFTSQKELEEITKAYEHKLAHLEEELEQIRNQQQSLTDTDKRFRKRQSQKVGANLNLTEAETRILIDQQLRDAGWEVDTEKLRFSKGARPEKGKNRAIAEWPLKEGIADYALFIGLEFVGIIEAKRASKDIPSDIEQAKGYARSVVPCVNEIIHEPWGDYFVPFLFATNGRPYIKQLEQKSGIWFSVDYPMDEQFVEQIGIRCFELVCWGRARWVAEAIRDGLQQYILEHLSYSVVVVVIAKTGFLKKGQKFVGVQRQYSRTADRMLMAKGKKSQKWFYGS